MKERIIEFLRTENKSSVQFALEIGVQPSSISHVISGRNNPSLDFVMKMLTRYPSLSAEWLLFGKGQMTKENTIPGLFDQSPLLNISESASISENESKERQAEDDSLQQDERAVQRNTDDIHSGSAKRIVCFFENNTFIEYFPAKK